MDVRNGTRQYDLVLLGATGYTGRFTAQHITASLPTDLKWAIAGRSHTRLTTIATDLKKQNGDRIQPGRLILIPSKPCKGGNQGSAKC